MDTNQNAAVDSQEDTMCNRVNFFASTPTPSALLPVLSEVEALFEEPLGSCGVVSPMHT